MAFWGFFASHPKGLKIFTPICIIFSTAASLHTIVYYMPFASATRNYTHTSFTQSFIKTTESMEKYYSLKEWKNIDIPALREEFLPVIQYAEDTKDEGLFYAALASYTYNFFDGHVCVWPIKRDAWIRGLNILAGNDYGFSMVKLADGRVVAINVSKKSAAYQNGIKNGTQIVSWNGISIDEAVEQTKVIYNGLTWAVKENEDFYKPVMLATKGKLLADSNNSSNKFANELIESARFTSNNKRPQADVEFILQDYDKPTGKTGKKTKKVTLDSQGSGLERFEVTFYSLTNQWKDHLAGLNENRSTLMLTDEIGYMWIYNEQSDIASDGISYFTGRHPKIRKELIKKIEDLKAHGMKKLIIDVRNNTGGFFAIDCELASLFSQKSFPVATSISCINGQHKELQTYYVKSDSCFSDIEVVLLTNNNCVSAGDFLVKVLSSCPNVTVMGLTSSNCSCQTTGGDCFLADGLAEIVFPVNWLFDTVTGERLIDTTENRKTRLPLDVKIPLTLDGVEQIMFGLGPASDYELSYAVKYLGGVYQPEKFMDKKHQLL